MRALALSFLVTGAYGVLQTPRSVYNPASKKIDLDDGSTLTLKRWRRKYAGPITSMTTDHLSAEWDQLITSTGRYLIPVFFDVDSQQKEEGASFDIHDSQMKSFNRNFRIGFKLTSQEFSRNTCVDFMPIKLDKRGHYAFDHNMVFGSNTTARDQFKATLKHNKKLFKDLKKRMKNRSFRYIDIRADQEGCRSKLGRTSESGPQGMSLAARSSCLKKTEMMRQFMHVIGFDNEHSRQDRDEFLIYHRLNMITRNWRYFAKRISSTSSFYSPYDFASLLQYNSSIYTKNSKPTLEINLDGEYLSEIKFHGQTFYDKDQLDIDEPKTGFTEWDIFKINSAYPCPEHRRPRNACLPNPCGLNNATDLENNCYTSLDGSDFHCVCYDSSGDVTNERTCSGLCNPNPCQNDGICKQNPNGDEVCECQLGWQGEFCDQCAAGYHGEKGVCRKNKCSCTNGRPGNKCAIHGTPKCGSCDVGYHLDGTTCVKNECWCTHGTAVPLCQAHNQELCKSCDSFYHPEKMDYGFTCKKNVCSCANGFASAICNDHGTESCKACNSLYNLDNRKCKMLPDDQLRKSIDDNLDRVDRKTLEYIIKVMDPFYQMKIEKCLNGS